MPSFVYYYDDGQEKKVIILMHILFLLDLFSAFLDISILNNVFNLLLPDCYARASFSLLTR